MSPRWTSIALALAVGLGAAGAGAAEDVGLSPDAGLAAHANAGHAEGWFFLRSEDDNFVLIPSGRLQMDFAGFQPAPAAPPSGFLLARARLETYGTLLKHWDFQLGGEFTSGTGVAPADVYVDANYTRYANVQLGQFDAPFTMENRTIDAYTDMQERARTVAALGIPQNKELGLMVWGQPEGKWAYWSGGVFNGEGVPGLAHLSNNFDVMGRAWFAPFGLANLDAVRWVWLGISEWRGDRVSEPSSSVDRPAMTDEAGFVFWNPIYGSIHVGDQGPINKWAVEANIPIGSMVIKAEVLSSKETTRELDESNPSQGVDIRNGTLEGFAYYIRASIFMWGDPLITGLGGMQNPPHLFGALKADSTDDALQFVLNAEQISFSYAARTLPNVPLGEPADPLIGDYGATFIGAGVNYWYTKNVRLTGNILYDVFAGEALRPQPLSRSEYEATLRAALVL